MNRVKELAKQKKIRLTDLASAAGIALNTMTAIAQQKSSTNVVTAQKIANRLGESVEVVFPLTPSIPKPTAARVASSI